MSKKKIYKSREKHFVGKQALTISLGRVNSVGRGGKVQILWPTTEEEVEKHENKLGGKTGKNVCWDEIRVRLVNIIFLIFLVSNTNFSSLDSLLLATVRSSGGCWK